MGNVEVNKLAKFVSLHSHCIDVFSHAYFREKALRAHI